MSAVNLSPQPGKQKQAFDCDSDIIIYGGSAGCLWGNSEILTDTGWKKISEYKEDDIIAVYNIDDESLLYEKPIKFIKEEYEYFYKISNNIIEKVCSPEHIILYVDYITKENVIEFADDFVKRILDKEDRFIYFIDPFDKNPKPFNIKDLSLNVIDSPDGYKYCLETSTGYFIIRENGNVIVTGNSGKSRLILLKACKLAYKDPNFEGVMFRRTTGPLRGAGGLFTEAKKLFAPLGVHIREKDMEILFKGTGGGSLKFTHLEMADDAEKKHQGLICSPF